NKYNVIKMDINGIAFKKGNMTIAQYYNKEVVPELIKQYPSVGLSEDIPLSNALFSIYEATGDRFVFIIDEHDLPIRDEKYASELSEYIEFLVSLFKNEETNQAIALAYLTGIMPIIKDKVQSKLNNFAEYTMLEADEMVPFMGFTEAEVKSLAMKSGMDFEELKLWYDGYNLNGIEVYSPKSVVTALGKKRCGDYWTKTSSYEAVTDYITLNLEGLKEDVVEMLSGGKVDVSTSLFRNTLEFGDKDDVLTYLIHLGYLAYDELDSTCYIPNNEIKDMWVVSLRKTKGYMEVARMINASKKLLEDTINGDENAVAEGVAKAHMECSSIPQYNNEASLQSSLRLAYYYAKNYYTVFNELPEGKGFADVAFIPYKPNVPAIIVELKKDDTVENAIKQIKDRRYPDALEKYKENILLVAICYDSKNKEYYCRIERS
ncbi:MAG: ATP-binding protein, partial [Spirochaetales bacterium]|nr:ATP-binding protein [Spirochaetales bacterium]